MKECLICHNKCHTGSWGFIETIPGKYTMKNTIYVCEKCNANINLEELKQLMLHNKFQSSIDLKLYIMKNKISRNGREINMEEIEYGEFLRLGNGKIVKYGEKKDTRVENDRYIDYSGEYEWKTRIVKYSTNIIDLIEVGDYVNGHKVTDVMSGSIYIHQPDVGTVLLYDDYQIKSIVTKEQFEKAEYKLDN